MFEVNLIILHLWKLLALNNRTIGLYFITFVFQSLSRVFSLTSPAKAYRTATEILCDYSKFSCAKIKKNRFFFVCGAEVGRAIVVTPLKTRLLY